MKTLKIFIIALMAGLCVGSCSKHELSYEADKIDVSQYAEFQLHNFIPNLVDKTHAAKDYYIDSVFVNGVLYSSVNGSGQLKNYNGVPGGAAGRFFAVKAGDVNLKLYQKGGVVYDKTLNLKAGKQNIIIHDLSEDPIILDNKYPYIDKSVITATSPATFNTDSVATVMFVNLLYEDLTTPYAGKLQYQYKPKLNPTLYPEDANRPAYDWKNLGEPVAFGEETDRIVVEAVKQVFNDSGSRRIDYRILDENGDVLQVINGAGLMKDYSDYWNASIGTHRTHFFCGTRTDKNAPCSVKSWGAL